MYRNTKVCLLELLYKLRGGNYHDKNDMDVLLFYLLFYKAVDELLKYSKNLNIEHLNVLYAIIDYHKTNHQGMDIETLMKNVFI